jgi:hypothetical protein
VAVELHFSASFPHDLRMKIEVKKIGGIWHGMIEGHPEIDERGLTEGVAWRKVGEVALKRFGATCGAKTRLFGGKNCDLAIGHGFGAEQREHRSGNVTWMHLIEENGH